MHRLAIALFGRALIPHRGGGAVLGHADTFLIQRAKAVLRRRQPARGRKLEPAGGTGRVGSGAAPLGQPARNLESGDRIAVDGRLAQRFGTEVLGQGRQLLGRARRGPLRQRTRLALRVGGQGRCRVPAGLR